MRHLNRPKIFYDTTFHSFTAVSYIWLANNSSHLVSSVLLHTQTYSLDIFTIATFSVQHLRQIHAASRWFVPGSDKINEADLRASQDSKFC
jgi:hypothetical protein